MCFVSIRTRTYSMEVKVIWLIFFNLRLMVFEKDMRNFWIPTVPWHTFTYHLEEVTGTLWHIYGNDSLLQIEPSGWKGCVTYGLGADTSLPPCLPTGIWTLVPKAITGPKSRGTSFGTTLWLHVQRYCVRFPLFMQIMSSGSSFLQRPKFPKTNLFSPFEQLKNDNFPFFSKSINFLFIFFYLRFFCFYKMVLEFIN